MPEAELILEGVVTTLDASLSQGAACADRRAPVDVRPNVSPMGPRVSRSMDRLVLKPFQSSRTYRNLQGHGEGVFHVTDDVDLIARAAVGRVEPRVVPAQRVHGYVLADSCRSYEFVVESIDASDQRAVITTRVVHVERHRDFFGFCRAHHAILEAAILATRVHILEREHVRAEFEKLRVLVDKTGAQREHDAFDFLVRAVEKRYADLSEAGKG